MNKRNSGIYIKTIIVLLVVSFPLQFTNVYAELISDIDDLEISGKESQYTPKDEDILGLNVGPGRIKPELKVTAGYDDNLLTQNTSTISTFYNILNPQLNYLIEGNKRKLLLGYEIEAGFYEGSSVDDYDDHKLSASFDYTPTSRIFTSIETNFKQSHDGRGTGRGDGGGGIPPTSLDEWHQWDIAGKFAYGSSDAKGKIELESGYAKKTYDTNRIFTLTRDRSDTFGIARFFYRILPKTHLLTEIRGYNYSYDKTVAGLPSLDSFDTTYLAGVTWNATYKTTGFVKLGYNQKDFDSSLREDGGGFTWEAGVNWRPSPFSTYSLKTSQANDETNGTGDFIDTTYYEFDWTRFWRAKLKTDLKLLYQNNTYTPSTREDDLFSFGVSAGYYFKNWLSFELGYRYETLDSNVPVFNYDQNVVEMSALLTF